MCETALFENDQMTKQYKVTPCYDLLGTHSVGTKVTVQSWLKSKYVHTLLVYRPVRAVSPRTDKSYVEHFCIHQRWSHPNKLVLYRNIARSHHKDLISTNMCVVNTNRVWTMQISVMSACCVRCLACGCSRCQSQPFRGGAWTLSNAIHCKEASDKMTSYRSCVVNKRWCEQNLDGVNKIFKSVINIFMVWTKLWRCDLENWWCAQNLDGVKQLFKSVNNILMVCAKLCRCDPKNRWCDQNLDGVKQIFKSVINILMVWSKLWRCDLENWWCDQNLDVWNNFSRVWTTSWWCDQNYDGVILKIDCVIKI